MLNRFYRLFHNENSSRENTSGFNKLPMELNIQILNYLNFQELSNLSQCNKYLNNLIKNEIVYIGKNNETYSFLDTYRDYQKSQDQRKESRIKQEKLTEDNINIEKKSKDLYLILGMLLRGSAVAGVCATSMNYQGLSAGVRILGLLSSLGGGTYWLVKYMDGHDSWAEHFVQNDDTIVELQEVITQSEIDLEDIATRSAIRRNP